jgi:hypothetical protein
MLFAQWFVDEKRATAIKLKLDKGDIMMYNAALFNYFRH